MSIAQEAVLARRDAVDHLERLLHTPEGLRGLNTLLEDAAADRRATKDQLSAALAAHVADLRAGLDALEHSQEALRSFESRFASVQALCVECTALVDAGTAIRRLGAVHANLRQTLASADAVATLPRQAAEAESLLSAAGADSAAGLLRAYLTLAELEATAVRVEAALESFKASRPGAALQIPSMDFYFAQVHRAMGRVEDRLWSTIRSFRSVARRNPALLVAALQAIEVQEGVDRELLAAGQGGSRLRKGWRPRCMQQLAASLQESFAPLLQRCSKLLAEDAAAGELLRAVLADAAALVAELRGVRDHVAPCFPPHYAVLHAVCAECHAQIASILDLIGLSAGRLSNGDILHCMRWLGTYQASMAEMKLKPALDAPEPAGVGLMADIYVGRVAGTLDAWLVNIVASDFEGEPQENAEGRLWTPGPVDLFRILDEQLGVAAPAGGALLRRVAAEAGRAMRSFQKATKKKLAAGDHPLEVLCAVANNSLRCRELGADFLGKARAAGPKGGLLDSDGEADLEAACAAFDDVGDAAIAACVDAVFSDPGFGELFAMVGHSEGWLSGTVTGSVLATLDDFMHDFEAWLQPALVGRLASRLLSETAAHFIAAVTMQLKSVRDDELRALRRDVGKLRAFFEGLVPTERVAPECQPLSDIADFLASDSVESFVLSYTTLLETAPGISPVLLSNLLAARVASAGGDMTKADAKEVMEACRQVYASKKQPAGGSGAGGGAGAAPVLKGRGLPGSRDAAFLAALNAARRKPTDVGGAGV